MIIQGESLKPKSFQILRKYLDVLDILYPKFGFSSRSEVLRDILSYLIKREALKLELDKYDT